MAGLAQVPWWEWFPFFRSWRVVLRVDGADEIPVTLPVKGVVFVGSAEHPKWLGFDCPCGSGHRIMVSLDSSHFPHWTLAKRKKLTLSPSIDYQGSDRRCHYFIRNGKTVWT